VVAAGDAARGRRRQRREPPAGRSEAEIERLKEGDVLASTFAEFAEDEARIFEPLIAERDRYMALRLRQELAAADAAGSRRRHRPRGDRRRPPRGPRGRARGRRTREAATAEEASRCSAHPAARAVAALGALGARRPDPDRLRDRLRREPDLGWRLLLDWT
jgi:hypothetical protein